MKTMKKKIVFISIIVLIVLTGISVFMYLKTKEDDDFAFAREIITTPGEAEEIEYMLFKKTMWRIYEDTIHPNAALLITNKEEMKTAQELFLAEQRVAHMCGYHYKVSFWYDADNLYTSKSMNKECETFNYKPQETWQLLDYYGNQLETNPTHYIYDLKIPVSIKPDEVRDKLKDSGLVLFFLDRKGKLSCYPSIYFSFQKYTFVGTTPRAQAFEENKKVSDKKIEEIINQVKSIASIIDESFYYNGGGIMGDSVYNSGNVRLRFEQGTDLSKVVQILEQAAGTKNISVYNPDFYSVQIIETSDDIEVVEQKLKRYKFIKEISKYKGD